MAVVSRLVRQHTDRRLLTHEKGAERRVSDRVEGKVWIRIRDGLAKYPRASSIYIVHHQPWTAEIRLDRSKQLSDGIGLARFADVPAHAMLLLECLENGLLGVPRGDRDMHTVVREESGAAGTHARPAAHDKGHLLLVRRGIAI